MSHSRFGDEGEYAYHLIFEFFGLGNVILTDHEFKIIALQRSVELDGVDDIKARPTLLIGRLGRII